MSICKNTIKYFFANLGNFLQLLEHELIQILVSNLQIFIIDQGAHGNGTNSQIFVILRILFLWAPRAIIKITNIWKFVTSICMSSCLTNSKYLQKIYV